MNILFLIGMNDALYAFAVNNKYASKDANGGNTPTYPHSVLCGCVTIDTTTASVYLATSPGQSMYAFSSSGCVAGADGDQYLGNIGGECHEVDTQFTGGRMQSVFFWVPHVCDVVDWFDGKDGAALEALLNIIGEA